MKRTAKQELRQKTVAELESLVTEARGELLRGRIAGAVEGRGLGGKAHGLRRGIARYLTIISEKQRADQEKTEVQP